MPVLALAAILVAAGVSAESMAEAAKREQARRKKIEEAGARAHVIDAEVVRTVAPPDPRATPRPTATDTPATDGEEAPDESEVRKQNEATWRQRVEAARARLAEAQKSFDWTQTIPYDAERLLDGQDRVIAEGAVAIEKVKADAKAELAAAREALERLLEDGRRAGVPPGWLEDRK